MDIKNFAQKIIDFAIKRIAELSGISLIAISILLFISLISYSPEDPNFIFPENTEIKNMPESSAILFIAKSMIFWAKFFISILLKT